MTTATRNTPFETMDEIAAYLGGDSIECLECGKRFRMITGKHLQLIHGMTQGEYRSRWGIPKTLGLATVSVKQRHSFLTLQMIADGVLTYDHLAAASNPKGRRPMTPKVPASRRAQSEMVGKMRPGDHAKREPGAKRTDGRNVDRAREYQQAYRAARAGDPSLMAVYNQKYSMNGRIAATTRGRTK